MLILVKRKLSVVLETCQLPMVAFHSRLRDKRADMMSAFSTCPSSVLLVVIRKILSKLLFGKLTLFMTLSALI